MRETRRPPSWTEPKSRVPRRSGPTLTRYLWFGTSGGRDKLSGNTTGKRSCKNFLQIRTLINVFIRMCSLYSFNIFLPFSTYVSSLFTHLRGLQRNHFYINRRFHSVPAGSRRGRAQTWGRHGVCSVVVPPLPVRGGRGVGPSTALVKTHV